MILKLARSIRTFFRPIRELPPCPISWSPHVLAPVFYGARDYGPSTGAPTPCQVYFPSLDGAVWTAPILEGCGRYPLVLFLHGHCPAESLHYTKWSELAAQLARGGYVVVVPQLPATSGGLAPWEPTNSDVALVSDLVDWMRTYWAHRDTLIPEPSTGIVGHSYGAMLGARVASAIGAVAYASLSARWHDWHSASQVSLPIETLTIPKFFAWGTQELNTKLDGRWPTIPAPKHSLAFHGGEHWDYLPAGRTACEGKRGACQHTPVLSWDFLATFFGKYMPPENGAALSATIPDDLISPPLALTAEQQLYAGGHLTGVQLLTAGPVGTPATGCLLFLRWETSAGVAGAKIV